MSRLRSSPAYLHHNRWCSQYSQRRQEIEFQQKLDCVTNILELQCMEHSHAGNEKRKKPARIVSFQWDSEMCNDRKRITFRLAFCSLGAMYILFLNRLFRNTVQKSSLHLRNEHFQLQINVFTEAKYSTQGKYTPLGQ